MLESFATLISTFIPSIFSSSCNLGVQSLLQMGVAAGVKGQARRACKDDPDE